MSLSSVKPITPVEEQEFLYGRIAISIEAAARFLSRTDGAIMHKHKWKSLDGTEMEGYSLVVAAYDKSKARPELREAIATCRILANELERVADDLTPYIDAPFPCPKDWRPDGVVQPEGV